MLSCLPKKTVTEGLIWPRRCEEHTFNLKGFVKNPDEDPNTQRSMVFPSFVDVFPSFSLLGLSLFQPSTGEKETREGWVKIDTIAADKSFSKVEPSSPHQYQPNRYSRINIKTRSFAPLTRKG